MRKLFRMVSAKDVDLAGKTSPGTDVYAMFVSKYMLAETDTQSGMRLGNNQCPVAQGSSPVAVVTSEHPIFLYIGLVLSTLGFFVQLLTVPRTKTINDINEEIRVLRKEKKLREANLDNR